MHRCGASPDERISWKLFQKFMAYQKLVEGEVAGASSAKGHGGKGDGGKGKGKGSGAAGGGKEFGKGVLGKDKDRQRGPALQAQVPDPKPTVSPATAPVTGPVRTCSHCGWDHNSQELLRCRNHKCRKPLPLLPGQEKTRLKAIMAREPQYLALNNKYAALGEEEGAGESAVVEPTTEATQPGAPSPAADARARLDFLKQHPDWFVDQIKEQEEVLKKAEEDQARATKVQNTTCEHDLALLYKKLDDLSLAHAMRKSKLEEETQNLQKARDDLDAKLADNAKHLENCEFDYNSNKDHWEGILAKAKAKAQPPEPAQVAPQEDTEAEDSGAELLAQETLSEIDGCHLPDSHKDLVRKLLQAVMQKKATTKLPSPPLHPTPAAAGTGSSNGIQGAAQAKGTEAEMPDASKRAQTGDAEQPKGKHVRTT